MNVIYDTNIFIHYFNGDLPTQAEIKKIDLKHVLIPSITKMELFRGMENKNKMQWMLSMVAIEMAIACNGGYLLIIIKRLLHEVLLDSISTSTKKKTTLSPNNRSRPLWTVNSHFPK